VTASGFDGADPGGVERALRDLELTHRGFTKLGLAGELGLALTHEVQEPLLAPSAFLLSLLSELFLSTFQHSVRAIELVRYRMTP
jgi:hypothetical protein